MTARRTAVYGVAGALLVAYLASANMPSPQDDQPRDRAPRPAATAGSESVAAGVTAQADKLHTRMAQAPIPNPNPRNPFAFGTPPRTVPLPERTVHAAVAETVDAPPPLPVLTLMGIAEETSPTGPHRTAIIGGERDQLYMVGEGQLAGDRYKVTKIGVDAVELEDIFTHAYRRIAMR